MDDSLTPARLAAEKRLQVKRRAKRGLIASYIHGLSERHRADGVARSAGTPDVVSSPVAAKEIGPER